MTHFIRRIGLAVVVFGAMAGPASATLTLTFSSSTPLLSGNLPTTTGTYATAVFKTRADDALIAANTVQLTWSVPTSESGLFVGVAGLNFTGQYTFTSANSLASSTPVTYNVNGINVQGTGNEKFNTNFDFPQSGTRLANGSPAIWNITGFSIPSNGDLLGLLKLNSSAPINGGGYYGAVHIQGYTNGSAGIAPSLSQSLPPTVAPEPSTLISASVGAIALMALGWCRRKAGKDVA